MSNPLRIAPSMLAADVTRLGDVMQALDLSQADAIHWDIMDGHFVDNLGFGPSLISALRPLTSKVFDAHLMVQNPEHLFEAFAKAGVQSITIHPQTVFDVTRALRTLHDMGLRAGLAFNPDTPLTRLEEWIGDVDLILMMTVKPGYGGQPFLPLFEKITQARTLIDNSGRQIDLQVDGGITKNNAPAVHTAGATTLVAGTAIFSHGLEAIDVAIATLRHGQ